MNTSDMLEWASERSDSDDSSLFSMDNETDPHLLDEYILDNTFIRASLCVAYTAVFFLCFFGNLTVVVVVTLHWRMRSVTKFCMGNLAFANLCVAVFCIYQNLSTFLQESWIFGPFLCKMYYFINSLSHTTSILILVVICVERYLSIVHPLRCRRLLTIQRLRLTIAGVWILSGLISAPRLYYMTTFKVTILDMPSDDGEDADDEVICAPTPTLYNSPTAEIIFFVLLFVFPLVIMTVLYARIGSIIWHSAVLQAVEMSKIQAPRTFREVPRVPNNSIVTDPSPSSSSGSHNNNNSRRSTIVSTLPRACGGEVSEMGKCNTLNSEIVNEEGEERTLKINIPRPKLDTGRSVFGPRDARDRNPFVVLRVKDERQGQVLRSRQAAIRMLIIIVISFAVCNFPYHLRRICQYYMRSYNIGSSFNQFITPITFLLVYTNCALNPILYAFMSTNFRSSVKDLLRLRLKRPPLGIRGRNRVSF